MTTEEIIADAMALPFAQRVSLAQALWESIDTGLPESDERRRFERPFSVMRGSRQARSPALRTKR